MTLMNRILLGITIDGVDGGMAPTMGLFKRDVSLESTLALEKSFFYLLLAKHARG